MVMIVGVHSGVPPLLKNYPLCFSVGDELDKGDWTPQAKGEWEGWVNISFKKGVYMGMTQRESGVHQKGKRGLQAPQTFIVKLYCLSWPKGLPVGATFTTVQHS